MIKIITFVLYVLVGILIGPFIWLFTRFGWLKPSQPLPPYFDDFNKYLWSQSLHATFSLQDVKVNHVECLAHLRFGLDPSKFRVVTLAKCATTDDAELAEREAATSPQYTSVRRNGTFVMGCTFSPPDPDLENRVVVAFASFGHTT